MSWLVGLLSLGSKDNRSPSAVRPSFTSWWSILGLLAASVSGFNLLRNLFAIQLSELLAAIAANYERFVHLPLRSLISWMHLPQPPTWAVDVALLWIPIGGVVLRSAWVLRSAAHQAAHEIPIGI